MCDIEGYFYVGVDYGVLCYMGMLGKLCLFGWFNDYFFYQFELEDYLCNVFLCFENVDVNLGIELIDLYSIQFSVMLIFVCDGDKYIVGVKYVIVCDGVCSQVCKVLGVKLDDLQFEEFWFVVDVEVDGLVMFLFIVNLLDDCDI